jgi:SHS2 domain-containing protein
MKGYRYVEDLTSDVMFEAYGKDLSEVFVNAAEAMFSIICKLKKVPAKKPVEVSVKGKDKEELMINWLQHLIGLVDTEEMFFSRFDIREIDEKHLDARILGDEIKPETGETLVKAVTYYKYKFEKTGDGYMVRVSLDI